MLLNELVEGLVEAAPEAARGSLNSESRVDIERCRASVIGFGAASISGMSFFAVGAKLDAEPELAAEAATEPAVLPLGGTPGIIERWLKSVFAEVAGEGVGGI
jgi:hypothetical protein